MGIKKILSLPLCIVSISILSMLMIEIPKKAESFYSPPFFNYSPWSSGPFYQPYISPPPTRPPLFGYGYPPGSPPFGFGPQPLLSLLNLAGLPAYFNSSNPGYPYSIAGYDLSTLFAGVGSPYPYASPFPAQTYPYLTPAVAIGNSASILPARPFDVNRFLALRYGIRLAYVKSLSFCLTYFGAGLPDDSIQANGLNRLRGRKGRLAHAFHGRGPGGSCRLVKENRERISSGSLSQNYS